MKKAIKKQVSDLDEAYEESKRKGNDERKREQLVLLQEKKKRYDQKITYQYEKLADLKNNFENKVTKLKESTLDGGW